MLRSARNAWASALLEPAKRWCRYKSQFCEMLEPVVVVVVVVGVGVVVVVVVVAAVVVQNPLMERGFNAGPLK